MIFVGLGYLNAAINLHPERCW